MSWKAETVTDGATQAPQRKAMSGTFSLIKKILVMLKVVRSLVRL